MSVRVVARIRPLQANEPKNDVILSHEGSNIRIASPKNENEDYTFTFNSVYGMDTPQEDIFHNEVAPTVKHLFAGTDVTLFAYGVTGTGKTHTMRGGKTLADRGVIPRLLSALFRRSKKIEKDSEGASTVEISMSYYEIYNDKVFDLFEPADKRAPAGLQLRDNYGKTVVVGLSERPCSSLKEFEKLYDQANLNRSTSATKLNAHSSRSHAILGVKVTVTTGQEVRSGVVSAIDLAGSEDNRRTENGKERMVESASINKSLFVLAQCVEAISKKQQRIPYRESKMTRILSLGQNGGITLMILNLAPLRSYHLDTLSSLNFANRTRKIETRGPAADPAPQPVPRIVSSLSGTSITRAPLRPTQAHNVTLNSGSNKTGKAFAVFSDTTTPKSKKTQAEERSEGVRILKPKQIVKPSTYSKPFESELSTARIEALVEEKVSQILAARERGDENRQPERTNGTEEALRRRLEVLEERIEKKDDARAEGLSYLLMAKQHQIRAEWSSALRMYALAQPFFPDKAEKIGAKMAKLRAKIQQTKATARKDESKQRPSKRSRRSYDLDEDYDEGREETKEYFFDPTPMKKRSHEDDEGSDTEYQDESSGLSINDGILSTTAKPKSRRNDLALGAAPASMSISWPTIPSPRSRKLLEIVNSRDANRIRALKGVGAKKAETILEGLASLAALSPTRSQTTHMGGSIGVDMGRMDENVHPPDMIGSLEELAAIRGVSRKLVDNMRLGVTV